MPFILDRSPTAKLVKSIDSANRRPDQLEQLQQIMMRDIMKMPYGYLDQALKRAQSMLPSAKNDAERNLLHSIYMMALRRIQRIHVTPKHPSR